MSFSDKYDVHDATHVAAEGIFLESSMISIADLIAVEWWLVQRTDRIRRKTK